MRLDPAATAAAVAAASVTWNATAHPWSPAGSFVDAIINEWIITFAALCAAFMVAQALFGRFVRVSRRRPDCGVAAIREADDR